MENLRHILGLCEHSEHPNLIFILAQIIILYYLINLYLRYEKRIDLIVPTTLFDIPLKHYQKFIKTFQGKEKEYTNEYAACKMLEIFCGLKKRNT